MSQKMFQKIRYAALEASRFIANHYVDWEESQRKALDDAAKLELEYIDKNESMNIIEATMLEAKIESIYCVLTLNYFESLITEINRREEALSKKSAFDNIGREQWDLGILRMHYDAINVT